MAIIAYMSFFKFSRMNKLMIILICLFITSCGSILSDPFVGKWQYASSSHEDVSKFYLPYLIEIEKIGSDGGLYKLTNLSESPKKETTLIRMSDTLRPPTISSIVKYADYFVLNKSNGNIRMYVPLLKMWTEYKHVN